MQPLPTQKKTLEILRVKLY